jgi:hypothetical protein
LYNRLEAFGITLVHLDVSRHQGVNRIYDVSKVSRKDKPTFLLRADDSLHKIPSEALNQNFPEGMFNEIKRVKTNKLIWSIKDLSDALKQNNTKLDSLTVVYVYDPETYQDDKVALRMMRHESSH